MSSTFDSSSPSQSNHIEDQENVLQESSPKISEEKNDEQIPSSESEEIDITTNNVTDGDTTTLYNSTHMVTAEASFSEATSADIPLGATRSSVARILVKPGQIFRVQVDNEVKEVHGKLFIKGIC